ncbi:hypothetical protein BGZ91_000359 [Linnemannia elongata]|nr:hypothetical protein BGZ91_000359 [Linnemannia elongata]
MATRIYPQWFHRIQKLFFLVAIALLITLPVLYGYHKIDISSTEVIVVFVLFSLLWALFSARVRLCIPSEVIESTLPIHTHAPEPTVILHDPASSRTAVPITSALKSSISTTTNPLHTTDTLEHQLSQEQEDEDEDIEQLKKKLAQDITFSSSTATTPAATVTTTTSPPPTVTKSARFAEGKEQIDDDMDRRQQRRRRQGSDGNIALDQLSSSTPPTSSELRRGYVSTPSSPISSPTTALNPPPHPLPSSSLNSSSPRVVSFQSKPVKRSSTDTRHGRSHSSSATASGVRFQRGLGSPSIGVSEEEDEDSLESSYPTFASYRQTQHAHFDAFAQRMRRTLETAAAATNAAATSTEVSSPPPLYVQNIPNPTAAALETAHTSDTSTHQQPSSQSPNSN